MIVYILFVLYLLPRFFAIKRWSLKNHVIQHNMICGLGMESQITRK